MTTEAKGSEDDFDRHGVASRWENLLVEALIRQCSELDNDDRRRDLKPLNTPPPRSFICCTSTR